MAAKMRECWADPKWRRRQLKLIQEGMCRPDAGMPGRRLSDTGHIHVGGKNQISMLLDPPMYKALAAKAKRQRKPLGEIIRTYIQWGLDEEGVG